MTIRPKLWTSIAIVASLCSVLLLAPGSAATARQTDRGAVMKILDQRGVVYTDVQVRVADPSVPQDHFAYVAAVVVEAEPRAYGKIECLAMANNCVLWIESLGVRQVSLPPRAATSLWERLNHHLDTVVVPLRAWLARVGQR
jgi:hypothetical protein